MHRLVSLEHVKMKNWTVKASIFDDHILIFFFNPDTKIAFCRSFYNEDIAHQFIETLLKVE